MARNSAWSLTLLGIFTACTIQASTAFGQIPPGGTAGNGAPTLGPADVRALMTNPFYARSRHRNSVQSGVNPASQQATLLQQQRLMEQQRTAEKAKKRDTDRERKQAAAKQRRAKEVQEREQKRQEATTAGTTAAGKKD